MTRRPPRPSPRTRVETLLAIALTLACGAEPRTPTTAGASPLGQLDAPSSGEAQWTGVVEQALDAKPYTYLAVRDGDALRWVAIMGDSPAPGAEVAIRSMGARRDFHSRRLDRTFDELVFGVIDDAARKDPP